MNHQLLNSQKSFVANVGILVTQKLHNQLLAAQLFDNTNLIKMLKRCVLYNVRKLTAFLLGYGEHIRQYRSWPQTAPTDP